MVDVTLRSVLKPVKQCGAGLSILIAVRILAPTTAGLIPSTDLEPAAGFAQLDSSQLLKIRFLRWFRLFCPVKKGGTTSCFRVPQPCCFSHRVARHRCDQKELNRARAESRNEDRREHSQLR